MKKDELKTFIGKRVEITLFDGDIIAGVLGYAETFSAEYDYRKPSYFYIGSMCFKVSHVKKIKTI